MTLQTMTYAKAVNSALDQELARDPSVVLFGEDISSGGVFTVTEGLCDRFGSRRVVDTPIAEAGFVGLATGAAAAGLRPVVELMFVDFALVAADQLLNQAAKLRFLSGGKITVPLTIRTQQGIVGGGGAQHSQSLEAILAHVPGLAVALPSTPADAKGLLATAIRMDEPAVFIEHKALYFSKGEVPEEEYLIPFGQAIVRRPGSDITLIAYSRAVHHALEAARQLEAQAGLSAEVVDLRTLVPLDTATIFESVSRTGRALVLQEASRTAGIGAELCAQITEACWYDLKAPVTRVTGLDIPIPYAWLLEQRWLPQPSDVASAAEQLVGAWSARIGSS